MINVHLINYLVMEGLATFAAAIVAIAAAWGIGRIGAHAMDAIARQPEAGGRIQSAMIISAALVEGVALFAVVVAMMGL